MASDDDHDTTADITAVSAPTPGVPYLEPPPLLDPSEFRSPHGRMHFRSEFALSINGLNFDQGLVLWRMPPPEFGVVTPKVPPAAVSALPEALRFNAGDVSPKAHWVQHHAPSAESAPAATPPLKALPPPKTRPPQAPAESAMTKAPPPKACVTAEHSAESWFAKAKAALAKAPPTPAGCTCDACVQQGNY